MYRRTNYLLYLNVSSRPTTRQWKAVYTFSEYKCGACCIALGGSSRPIMLYLAADATSNAKAKQASCSGDQIHTPIVCLTSVEHYRGRNHHHESHVCLPNFAPASMEAPDLLRVLTWHTIDIPTGWPKEKMPMLLDDKM